ncbi:MetQ/NlpA family lipoprotein [Clostridium bovifaecis]|uniref:Lipoprotein n=1 Tax=Clostridium bovifaecis TaxID=2184719 RepID=A0A6I6EXB8_9CLOT|nr:MetQ/NlpA family lipoprotein [Clostridium bovifaecis]
MKKRFLSIVLASTVALGAFGLTACGNKDAAQSQDKKKIVIGATPQPHSEILEKVKPILKEKGYDLEVKIFNDYVIPNTAVEEGDLDANFFQHVPYLEQFNKEKGTHLAYVAKVHLEPMGVYSDKIKDLKELKDGTTIAVPNDPTNEARALRLLEKEGIAKFKEGELITKLDITENPKNIKIEELEAAQLPTTLKDVDAAVINTNYALPAGLNPTKDALAIEEKDSPYANVIAVKEENKDKPYIKALAEAINSPEIKKFIEENYKGSIIPSF